MIVIVIGFCSIIVCFELSIIGFVRLPVWFNDRSGSIIIGLFAVGSKLSGSV